MDLHPEILHPVLAIGALYPPVERLISRRTDMLSSATDRLHRISDLHRHYEPTVAHLKAMEHDIVWLLVNESELLCPAVAHAISELTQVSAVFLECYCAGLGGTAEHAFSWPRKWPQDVGAKGICLSYYDTSTLPFLLQRISAQPARAVTANANANNVSGAAPKAIPQTDPCYVQARHILLSHQRFSISLVQRHLHIGYRHAERLVDAIRADPTAHGQCQ